jgi:hypothetical protein
MFLPFKPLVPTVVLESYLAVVANTVSDRTSNTLRNSTLIINGLILPHFLPTPQTIDFRYLCVGFELIEIKHAIF